MDKEIKHNIEFMNQKVGKNNGFSTPDDYFEGLENDILAKLSAEELPKENAFDVPTDYFTTLEDDIITKISSEEKETKVIPLYDRVRKFIPYIAVASVLLLVGMFYINNFAEVSYEDISTADVETWFDNGYGETNDTEMAMILEDIDFTTDEEVVSFEDADLDEYINLIDKAELINELENSNEL